jgi:hypothetical protein
MLLKILRTLEGLSAEFAFVRLQGHMHSDVRGNVVAFDGSRSASTPSTGQAQVVGTLSSNVDVAEMVVKIFRGIELFDTTRPLTSQFIVFLKEPEPKWAKRAERQLEEPTTRGLPGLAAAEQPAAVAAALAAAVAAGFAAAVEAAAVLAVLAGPGLAEPAVLAAAAALAAVALAAVLAGAGWRD